LIDSNGLASKDPTGSVDREQRKGRHVFAPIPKPRYLQTWTRKTSRQVRIEGAATLKLDQGRA
jgi:hypothetical protein